jgi:hypothetical protein
MSKARNVILRIVEIVLLVPAFGFLIPEVPSQKGHVYHLFPGLAFAVVLFACAQFVSIYRDRQAWWASTVKILLFILFGWLLFERFTMGPMN